MMHWTRSKPTQPGWYWWRRTRAHERFVVQIIYRIDGVLPGLWVMVGPALHDPVTDTRWDGEWSDEPIAEPEEAR